jgi:hypothetical protein
VSAKELLVINKYHQAFVKRNREHDLMTRVLECQQVGVLSL